MSRGNGARTQRLTSRLAPQTASVARDDFEDDIQMRELLARIDERLPVAIRATYLQMRAGKSVPKARRAEVEAAVRVILGSDGA